MDEYTDKEILDIMAEFEIFLTQLEEEEKDSTER